MTPGSVAPRAVHSVRPGSTTTWPTCRDVILSYFSSMDLCSTLPSSPFLFQFSQMLSSDSPGTLSLSLSLCQNHQASCTKTANHTCNAWVAFPLIFLTLTTTARNPIAYICQIYHTALGHRYFNLAMTCGIYPRYAHASHKSASAFRFPTLWDDHGTLPWCLAGSHSDEHLQATVKSHSMRTIRVCTSLKTLVTLSKPIIHSM